MLALAVAGMTRALRFAIVPIAVGTAIGFALLWLDARHQGMPQASAPGFSDAVARAAPAVVSVFSLASQHPLCDLAQFRIMCERFYRGRSRNSLGSGVVMREDGYVLTNRHAIAAGDNIVVRLASGEQLQAALVGTDRGTDLAVLKVARADMPAIEQASSEAARVGDFVLAIGNPFGIGVQAASLGIVSAKGSYRVDQSPFNDDFIQTDAAINPGNSGGALVDRQGRLLGINTLFYSGGDGGSAGVGLAIPVERATAVMAEIIDHGRVLRGWLGIVLDDAPSGEPGLVIVRVYRGTPAARAGLKPGDLLLSINAEQVGTARDATLQLREMDPGAELTVRIWRNGAIRQVRLTTVAFPAGN